MKLCEKDYGKLLATEPNLLFGKLIQLNSRKKYHHTLDVLKTFLELTEAQQQIKSELR